MGIKRRIAALLIALAMVFAMAFSVLFVVHKAEHNCTGVDCQVCSQINHCIKLFEDFSPKPETAVYHVSLVFAVVLCLGAVRFYERINSLITLKVKLSD